MNAMNTPNADGEHGLTQREAAARLGKSPGWINRLVKDGTLALLPNGRIDPASLAQPTPARPPGSSGPAINSVGQTSAQARAEKDRVAARMAGLDYAQRVGQVTSVADVEAVQTTIARAFRDGILALPAQLAPSLINITDPRQIETALRRAFTTFLASQVAALNDESPPT